MSIKYRQSLGRWGELVAASYLEGEGYAIVDRNARTDYGEIDLIAEKGGVMAFIEVKTRTSERYGNPEEAITAAKREHMLAAAQAYLQAHPEIEGDWRVDVIAIRRTQKNAAPQIVHFENAITES